MLMSQDASTYQSLGNASFSFSGTLNNSELFVILIVRVVFQVPTLHQEVEEEKHSSPVDSDNQSSCEDRDQEEVPPFLLEEDSPGEEESHPDASVHASDRCGRFLNDISDQSVNDKEDKKTMEFLSFSI